MAKNIFERQEILSAFFTLKPEDIAGGGFTLKLPQGARVTAVVPNVETAFDTAGTGATCKLTVTDGTSVFVNAQSLLAAGAVTVAVTNKFYPTGGTITGAITEAVTGGAVTTAAHGLATIRVDYVQLGRQCVIEG